MAQTKINEARQIDTTGQSYFLGRFEATVVSHNTWTLLPCSEAADTLGEYSAGIFTATATGTYYVSAHVCFNAAVGSTVNLSIYKNGSNFKKNRAASLGAYETTGITSTVQLSAGDTIGIYILQVAGSNRTIQADSGLTMLNISKVS